MAYEDPSVEYAIRDMFQSLTKLIRDRPALRAWADFMSAASVACDSFVDAWQDARSEAMMADPVPGDVLKATWQAMADRPVDVRVDGVSSSWGFRVTVAPLDDDEPDEDESP